MAWRPAYLTGTQLRAWMRVAGAGEEALYADAAEGASRAIDRNCNRQFGTVGAQTRKYTPWWNSRRLCWMLTVDDYQDATGLAVTVTDGVIDPTLYLKSEPANAVVDGRAFTNVSIDPKSPVQPRGTEFEAAVALTTWGWAAFPNAVINATRLQGSRFAARRDSPYGVAGSPDLGNELRLLAKLDADLKPMLSFYVRPRRPF